VEEVLPLGRPTNVTATTTKNVASNSKNVAALSSKNRESVKHAVPMKKLVSDKSYP
jgi:hypothetical protein